MKNLLKEISLNLIQISIGSVICAVAIKGILIPNAFVVVTETLEVMGYRIGNQPHW